MTDRKTENERRLAAVARKLPVEIRQQAVFLGGAVVGCLVTDTGAADVRPTYDVDLIVDVASRSEYRRLEEQLRKCGFVPAMEEGAPICRWRIGEEVVDIMPCSADILGFSNRWYPAASQSAKPTKIGDVELKIITAPYFLATKMETFLGRGNHDYLGSPDMEDIITLIEGRKELEEEVRAAPADLRAYIGSNFQTWLGDRNFLSCIAGHVVAGAANQDRTEEVKQRMGALASLDPYGPR